MGRTRSFCPEPVSGLRSNQGLHTIGREARQDAGWAIGRRLVKERDLCCTQSSWVGSVGNQRRTQAAERPTPEAKEPGSDTGKPTGGACASPSTSRLSCERRSRIRAQGTQRLAVRSQAPRTRVASPKAHGRAPTASRQAGRLEKWRATQEQR